VAIADPANHAPTGGISFSGVPTDGFATENQVLTAVTSSLVDLDGLGALSYQWQRSANGSTWSDIGSATASTMTLGNADVGNFVRLAVTYVDGLGTTETVISDHSASAVLNVDDAPTGSVSITGLIAGNPVQNQTLTASNTLADADGLGTITYQWFANDTPISGATDSTFVPSQTEVGKLINVSASYTDGHGTDVSVLSATTDAVVDANDAPTGSVTIGGSLIQGETLSVSNDLADLDGVVGAISYQWKADGSAINGATSETYDLTQAEVGKAITVTASYTDGLDTAESVTSSASSAVANVNDLPTGAVNIGGEATQGQTLLASNTLADLDGLGTISYQWNAAGTAITGATSSSYVLTQAEVGKAITVTASYTDAFDTHESMSSSATSAVANVNDAPTGSVTIGGSLIQGQSLSASNTLADLDGLGTINYQWNAGGSAIVGATTSSYVLTHDEVGKAITVTASYTDAFNTAESVSSSATALVESSEAARIEDEVPGIPPAGGGSAVAGDGNGDGVADSTQASVESLKFHKTSAITDNPNADSTYVTLVADPLHSTTTAAQLSQVAQADAPTTGVPAALDLPLGLISFTATLNQTSTADHPATETFSLYVDSSVAVNGYWKLDDNGIWNNLATHIETANGKTRIDFAITDGSQFDADGLVNGVIVDPGAVGTMPLSIVGLPPEQPASHIWF
jgi:hypothetical protein